jgi:hypothetical protein
MIARQTRAGVNGMSMRSTAARRHAHERGRQVKVDSRRILPAAGRSPHRADHGDRSSRATPLKLREN